MKNCYLDWFFHSIPSQTQHCNSLEDNSSSLGFFCFNSMEFGVPELEVPEMEQFAQKVPGLEEKWKRRVKDSREFGVFDFIFTNPPFGAKIPISNLRSGALL
ncbi:hypothetical protein [Leptolyngbya sp. 7M]|uniref:hypothetical protein n=1 Tax=Leptolyngbya sp. 7M TaxID=2812896 RepID=UPI001B8B43D0|nr:hypothetical protein [Leptolyngbya sp. 7M]QYO68065.1 hypothetical protein JVX88_15590 [Leptolyngbya sp. 7M]